MSLKIRNECGKALDIWICIGDKKALGHIPEERVTVKLNVPPGADALEYRYGKRFFFSNYTPLTRTITHTSLTKNTAGGTNVRRIKFDKPIAGDMQESFVIDESGNIKKGDKVQKHVVKAHTPQGVCVLKVTNHSSNTAEILIVYPHGKSKGKVNGRSRMSMRCPPGAVAFQYVVFERLFHPSLTS